MTATPGTSRRRRTFALGVLIVVTTVVSALAAFANPPTDDWLYVQVRALDLPTGISELQILRAPPVIGLLALMGFVGWRCRAVVKAYLVALLASVGIAVGLNVVVARPRPFDSYLTTTDSYPSPAITALTVIAVMVPFGLRVRGSRVLAVVAAILLWAVVAAAGFEEVYAALRWPLDVIGAVLLGATASVAALAAVEHPGRLHARCDDCPWQRGESAAERPAYTHGGWSHPLYRIALVWTLALAAGFGYLAYTRGIPRPPEATSLGDAEVVINLALVGLLVVGVLLAARLHVTGAVIVALAAVLLGYASSVQYEAWVAAAVTAAAFVPALLLWVQWHRTATVRAAITAASVTSLLLAGVIYAAATNYSRHWGPSHPVSATPAPPSDVVQWMWAGAVTETSVEVRARSARDGRVRLVVSKNPKLTNPSYSDPQQSRAASHNVVALTVDGLTPDRDYYYALEVNGTVEQRRVGHFATFPRGPSSFTFAVGSDSRTGSNGVVYDAVRRTRPLLYLNVGDFFYGDIPGDRPERYRSQYDANLTAPSQAALYATAPIAYVWGDHDFATNGSDRTSPGRPAAMEVYRENVPHYPLHAGAEGPIYQAFTVGGVRFIVTDNRSMRDPAGTPNRSMLGRQQRKWLLGELARADRYGLVVWANPDPWVAAPNPAGDTWGGFARERRVIADAIAENKVDNLLMVSGDAHMLAYDNGEHTDYASSGRAAFPLFQAAALDQAPSIKGGPYTGPVIPGGGQFGTVEVRDDGKNVRVTVVGRNWQHQVLFTRTFSVSR
ncbi:MAG TPA: alkaline phosphatase D family protein [Nocardioidaceae bacterium]|nr:alkaline phosphatase D family protein [Nocardioidaceae bacterium]